MPSANQQDEINSLAAEIVHPYEELHLLYELGDVPSSDLTVSDVTNMILDKLVRALNAGYAELSLVSVPRPVRVGTRPGSTAGADHWLKTALRNAGGVVGTLTVERAREDQPFSSHDAKLLDAVGTLAANAVRNAQLIQELRSNEAHLRAVLDNVAEGIITVDDEHCIASFNPAAERIFGYAANDVIGQQIHLLLEHPGNGETTANRADGHLFPVDLSVSDMRLDDQHLLIYSVRDITARKKAEAALEHQALHDALTDLPNRVLLHDRLQQAIRVAQRDGVSASVALLVMDLDRFKEVNDTFGHSHWRSAARAAR